MGCLYREGFTQFLLAQSELLSPTKFCVSSWLGVPATTYGMNLDLGLRMSFHVPISHDMCLSFFPWLMRKKEPIALQLLDSVVLVLSLFLLGPRSHLLSGALYLNIPAPGFTSL